MANTVNLLSYANTFGEWMITTNGLVRENNDFGYNNYFKPTGTLYLNDPNLGLQVANNVIIAGSLQVQGVGSSGYIQNNLRVDGQVYFTNTTLGLTNTGQANIGGPLLALGAGNGLQVSNDALINGNLTIYKAITANTLTANSIIVNKVHTETLNATSINSNVTSNLINVDNILVNSQLTVNGNFVLTGTTVYNTNKFTINAGSGFGLNSYYSVARGSSSANAEIRWNEVAQYWDILDVNNSSNYSRILTANLISDSLISTSSLTMASSKAANTLNNGIQTNAAAIITANNSLKSYVDTNITAVNSFAQGAYNKANSASSTFNGTSGSATSNATIITINSTNGMTVTGVSNTLTINTPQDVRTSASPSLNGLTLSTPLSVNSGGTGSSSSAGALTNLLPSGTTAGYVLTTGGPGTFYWAAGGTGGGGGATPGTTISSTRLFPTVNASQTVFVTPTYVPGSSQLRVYINGVRQYNSDYTETSNTIVTLGTGTFAGDVVMLEVDGYINNPYYANNITFTSPFGNIVSTANTIQLAIQDLETRKAAVSSNVQFTSIGVNTAPDTTNLGSIRATGAVTAYYSDERLKTKLGNIENALDKLISLSGFYYEANETAQALGYNVKREVGVSAQEVQRVLPEVVEAAPISDEYLTVQYDRIVPLIIEAIKELKSEVDAIKGK
jgi:hypothetical protein